MPREQIVQSVTAMHELAAEVATTLRSGDVLLLSGELGAGKTTFVVGLAAALGVTEAVTSPSFTIATEYAVPTGHVQRLVHVDLYRLAGDSAAQDPAVREVLATAPEAGRVTVIEWAERLGAAVKLVGRTQRFVFMHGETAGQRRVRIE